MVVESIYTLPCGSIVPLYEVVGLEKSKYGYNILTRGCTWNTEEGGWNSMFVRTEDSEDFIRVWCSYRRQLEKSLGCKFEEFV